MAAMPASLAWAMRWRRFRLTAYISTNTIAVMQAPGRGTQLRHLLELLDGAVSRAYDDAGLPYRPRYAPVMRALLAREPSPLGQIAESARITQPAATQTVALLI